MHLHLSEVTIVFFIFSFLGWCMEVFLKLVDEHIFVNRGFLNGPLCPLYGFGVTGVVIIFSPIKDNVVLLFIGSMVFCTVIEYITGVILEKLFHDTWWDYSDQPLQLCGQI